MGNWKEKYEQSLDRAKFLKENCDSVNAKDISSLFEEIFSELRESEGEKIRKELIDIVKKSPITFAFDNKDKVLAWLDAQKETNLSSQEVKEAAEEFMLTQDTYNSRNEYQIMHAFISGANWKEKQRCEWSEDDEKIRKDMIDYLKAKKKQIPKTPLLDFDRWISWIEKQKPIEKIEPITEGLKTEFQKQVSHLIASVYEHEWPYTRGFVEYTAQQLLGYANNELKQKE